jgi:hypothetical protein
MVAGTAIDGLAFKGEVFAGDGTVDFPPLELGL